MTETSEATVGDGDTQPSPRADPIAASPADQMREELRAVLESPEFARAPIMKRLLSFLVEETASGRGDQLKAYSVAVDGLGRAPDYDARADSYPRVQVGRLRRMLDSYYRSSRAINGLRLAIPSGRYRVTMEPTDGRDGSETAADAQGLIPKRPFLFGWNIALVLLLVCISTALLLRLMPLHTRPLDAGRERPVLEMGGTTMARSSDLGNMIRVTLINGLGRSGIYDLRPIRRSGQRDPKAIPPRYRLGADLIGGDHPRLFLRLSRADPDRLIWSGDVSLGGLSPQDGEAIDQRLAPMIATLGRVNGLIAAHELQENAGIEASGYSCLLLYHRYRKERTELELRHVESCMKRSLERNPDDVELQAAASQLAIEKMVSTRTDPRDRPALLLTAQRHAQLSASIDPFDPWSNAARARVALARNACPSTISFAIRASELQPYDPTLLADAGIYLLDCGDPRAERLIRRAIALDDDPDGRFYAQLLLLAIARDDQTMAREALDRMTPPLIGRHGLFYLISATGHAMIGDMKRARMDWDRLKADSVAVTQDPRGIFDRIGYSAGVRDKALNHLRRAGLIGS